MSQPSETTEPEPIEPAPIEHGQPGDAGDADVRADAIRRMQAIYRKARELQEERGIKAGYLATGLARWDELFLEPAAPGHLRPASHSHRPAAQAGEARGRAAPRARAVGA